jgi:hypothetical protein
MEASPIDFYLQNLLLPYIREVNLGTKVIEEGELVRLGRRLENYRTEAELLDEPVGESEVQPSFFIEETDPTRALPGLDHELYRSSIKPPLTRSVNSLTALLVNAPRVSFPARTGPPAPSRAPFSRRLGPPGEEP